MLLDRAFEVTGLGEAPSSDERRRAFINLVETVLHQEDDEDEQAETIKVDKAEGWWRTVQKYLAEEFSQAGGGFARMMYGDTKQQTRRLMQLAFNRPESFPRVLVAQSVVGREGLNLHEACRHVVLLHPEWSPGVVEQQIGRVDRIGSQRVKDMRREMAKHRTGDDKPELPRISIQSVTFRGTYDESNWMTQAKRWDELRATLHGIIIPDELAQRAQ